MHHQKCNGFRRVFDGVISWSAAIMFTSACVNNLFQLTHDSCREETEEKGNYKVFFLLIILFQLSMSNCREKGKRKYLTKKLPVKYFSISLVCHLSSQSNYCTLYHILIICSKSY